MQMGVDTDSSSLLVRSDSLTEHSTHFISLRSATIKARAAFGVFFFFSKTLVQPRSDLQSSARWSGCTCRHFFRLRTFSKFFFCLAASVGASNADLLVHLDKLAGQTSMHL